MGSSKEIPRKRKRGQDDKQEGSDQALDNARAQATALRVADSDWWHDLVHRLSLLSKDLAELLSSANGVGLHSQRRSSSTKWMTLSLPSSEALQISSSCFCVFKPFSPITKLTICFMK
eukprot:c24393_g1_i2 orf=481-834(+)